MLIHTYRRSFQVLLLGNVVCSAFLSLSIDVSPMGIQVINESLPIFLDSAVSIHRLGI